jgi:hypothetical protein
MRPQWEFLQNSNYGKQINQRLPQQRLQARYTNNRACSRFLVCSELYLTLSNIGDASVSVLARAFQGDLQALHIAYCAAVTDRGLAALVNYCRNLTDLNLYGCTGLSRHALSFLRLCPLIKTVDISRISNLDDASLAEWILPTPLLQQQQSVILQMIQQSAPQPLGAEFHGPGGAGANTALGSLNSAAIQEKFPEYNPNLPQIFQAQAQHPNASWQHHATTELRSLSLDSCPRVSSLGLKGQPPPRS